MAESLESLLNGWGLSSIVSILQEANVGIKELPLLREADLDKLFPSLEMVAKKAILRNKLESLQPASINSTFHMDISEKPIEDILRCTPRGQDILENMEHSRMLTPRLQQDLVNCLIDHHLARAKSLSLKELEGIADDICEVFPNEVKTTYFCRRKNKKPCGKLYDRYYNMRRNSISSQTSKESACSHDADDEDEVVDTSVMQSIQTWLKYNDGPLEEVSDKWKITHQIRKRDIKNNNYILEWPLIKNSNLAPHLIDLDYTSMFPDKPEFFPKWEYFASHIYDFYLKFIKDKKSLELLNKVNYKNVSQDSRNYIIATLMNAIVKPNAKFKVDGHIKKVTIQEAMDAFILIISSEAEIDEAVYNMKQRFGLIQPIIIVVGDILTLKSFYIYFDGIKLKFFSFLSALETCFKVYQVFNIEYPLQCKGVWYLIQKYFFNVNNASDEKIPQADEI